MWDLLLGAVQSILLESSVGAILVIVIVTLWC